MNKERSKPIFYHPDECDCIECDARRQPEGLDHDPSNDNAEFEDHEEEVMKEIEKGSIYKKNQTIKFEYPNDFTGIPSILTGTVIGHGKEVRQKWPIECAEASDDTLLVKRQDVYGNIFHHAVNPEEIIQDAVAVLKNEA